MEISICMHVLKWGDASAIVKTENFHLAKTVGVFHRTIES